MGSIDKKRNGDPMKVCLKRFSAAFIACLSLFFCMHLSAQQLAKISQSAWLALSPAERELIQRKHVVDLVEQDAFGIIIDNQTLNESSGGTVGGASLGGAIANATYIDNAIKGGNYSAKTQLAAGLLGAILGSSLDSKPVAQYHLRYAIRLGSGNIKYIDETKGDPFRHPVGVCVSVPNIKLIDQHVCGQTVATLRATYLQPPVEQIFINQPAGQTVLAGDGAAKIAADSSSIPALVNCKLGTLAPVRTSAEKCQLIKGSQVQ